MFSTGITDTAYAPTMDASIRGTIYYNQSGALDDYYESFRLEYRSGSGIHFSNRTYKAGFSGRYIRNSIDDYTTDFTKNVAQWGIGSMHLDAWTDVSGNGSTDSIALAISQVI